MMQTAIVDGPIDEPTNEARAEGKRACTMPCKEEEADRQLTTEQVEDIVRQFGDAAYRAKQAGYDGVQVHAAHFFYLSKFISPLCNHRNDRYGGDQRERSRILYEILKDMRSKTSPDFLITMKINSTDEYPGGLTTQDFMLTSRLMAEAGIDAIEVSANGTSRTGIKAGQNEGYFRAAAMALAAYVDTPVVQTGDTTPSKCVSCNTCYRTPGHLCIFNLRAQKTQK